MGSLIAALLVACPALWILAAERSARWGRSRRHPEHAHAVRLAGRYAVLTNLVWVGLFASFQMVLSGGVGVVVAAALCLAALRDGKGHDAAMEKKVHLVFGGSLSTMLVLVALVLGDIALTAAGVSRGVVTGMAASLVGLHVIISALALNFFCLPLQRRARPPAALADQSELDGIDAHRERVHVQTGDDEDAWHRGLFTAPVGA